MTYKLFSWNPKLRCGACSVESFATKEEATARRYELEASGLATRLETRRDRKELPKTMYGNLDGASS